MSTPVDPDNSPAEIGLSSTARGIIITSRLLLQPQLIEFDQGCPRGYVASPEEIYQYLSISTTHIGVTISSSRFFRRGQKHIFFDNYMLMFPAKEEMPSRCFPYATYRAKRDQQRDRGTEG
jgi:hypothetical protein